MTPIHPGRSAHRCLQLILVVINDAENHAGRAGLLATVYYKTTPEHVQMPPNHYFHLEIRGQQSHILDSTPWTLSSLPCST